MVCIYFTNCFGWHAKKTPNGIRDKTFKQEKRVNEIKKNNLYTWTLHKVSKTQLECIHDQGAAQREKKKQLNWKTINETHLFFITFVSHTILFACQNMHSPFLHRDAASISVFYNPLKFIALDITDMLNTFLFCATFHVVYSNKLHFSLISRSTVPYARCLRRKHWKSTTHKKKNTKNE